MKEDAKYFFVGNRFFIFEEMQKLNCKFSKIMAVNNSYFEKYLISNKIEYIKLVSKKQLVSEIKKTSFDILISNGCPYILPVEKLQENNRKKFINIHPSYLPDLKGADPQPAALLFARNSGATCHIMNDEIDEGDIISQIIIPYSEDMDIALLYQISFTAEKEVFNLAYNKYFSPDKKQKSINTDIYYTFKPEDLIIDFSKSAKQIYQQIKAFNNKSKGAYFNFNDEKVQVYDVELISNKFIHNMYLSNNENEVVLKYENKLLLKKADNFLKLKEIVGDISNIKNGTVL